MQNVGELTHVSVTQDQSSTAAGDGLATCKDPDHAQLVLAGDESHKIREQSINGTKTLREGEMEEANVCKGAAPEDLEKKLFVGGLAFGTVEDHLREYFAKFGTLTNVTIPVDPETKLNRTFGFVSFESPDSVKVQSYATIKNTEISVQTQFLSKIGLLCRSLVPLHGKRDLFPSKKVQSQCLNRMVAYDCMDLLT